MESNNQVNVLALKKAILTMMVVGVLFYIGVYMIISGIEYRIPSRFAERKLPENLFLYIKLASFLLFAFLSPAYFKLIKLYQALGKKEVSLHDINLISRVKSIFWSFIIPWVIYSITMMVIGSRIGGLKF